ncbi:MAG: L-seryl-tRNA(Sec) selenium transferase [Candidatus Baltobacteraceae bacterium]
MTDASAGPSQIPPVHRLLGDGQIAAYETKLGRRTVKAEVNSVLEAARRSAHGVPSFAALRDTIALRLAQREYDAIVPVVNATGVLLHTNLGRAPLAGRALDAAREIGAGYSNLEFDLENGVRGTRYARASGLLRELTGAQDAIVVNNCAAAVFLIVDTFAKGGEVIVSRGELVEVGGGFRIPDVLVRAGATLIEVGSTNKTTLDDYRRALTARTALLLRTHASNYRITGFTHAVDAGELAQLAHASGVPAAEDLGSGALTDLAQYGLPHERTVQEALASGMDLVAFSGDKMLGGPQAGIIAGSRTLIGRLRNNPLVRALRAGKMTFALLAETLRCYASAESRAQIPFYTMLGATLEALRERGARYVQAVPGVVLREVAAYAGGGTLPEAAIASVAVAPALGSLSVSAAHRQLRLPRSGAPIVARIDQNVLLLDLRTVLPAQDAHVIAALRALVS